MAVVLLCAASARDAAPGDPEADGGGGALDALREAVLEASSPPAPLEEALQRLRRNSPASGGAEGLSDAGILALEVEALIDGHFSGYLDPPPADEGTDEMRRLEELLRLWSDAVASGERPALALADAGVRAVHGAFRYLSWAEKHALMQGRCSTMSKRVLQLLPKYRRHIQKPLIVLLKAAASGAAAVDLRGERSPQYWAAYLGMPALLAVFAKPPPAAAKALEHLCAADLLSGCLHAAAMAGDEALCAQLLRIGADAAELDAHGFSAAERAEGAGYDALARVLRRWERKAGGGGRRSATYAGAEKADRGGAPRRCELPEVRLGGEGGMAAPDFVREFVRARRPALIVGGADAWNLEEVVGAAALAASEERVSVRTGTIPYGRAFGAPEAVRDLGAFAAELLAARPRGGGAGAGAEATDRRGEIAHRGTDQCGDTVQKDATGGQQCGAQWGSEEESDEAEGPNGSAAGEGDGGRGDRGAGGGRGAGALPAGHGTNRTTEKIGTNGTNATAAADWWGDGAAAALGADPPTYCFDSDALGGRGSRGGGGGGGGGPFRPWPEGDAVGSALEGAWDAAAVGRKVQLFLGPAGSGAPMHAHGPAFNALAEGRKRWALLPPAAQVQSNAHPSAWHEQEAAVRAALAARAGGPAAVPDLCAAALAPLGVAEAAARKLVGGPAEGAGGAEAPAGTAEAEAEAVAWKCLELASLRAARQVKGRRHCEQSAGDVLFVPAFYAHATINLDAVNSGFALELQSLD